MSDLVEFLRARFDDDERVALACGVQLSDGKLYLVGDGDTITIGARRVLAEVDAKRRILGWADTGALPAYEVEYVLTALALPYADHPDYDEAWRP